MPEMPEVEALASFLRKHATGMSVLRIDVLALSALKTADPPVTSLQGATVRDVSRHGKFLDIVMRPADAAREHRELHLVLHLARAGWLRWRDEAPAPAAHPGRGRGPLALRLVLESPQRKASVDVTEAGTRKSLAVYVVGDPREVPGVARLGPEALSESLDVAAWQDLARGARTQLKGWLTDQRVVAGIGNAYSDEILHAARLSPFRLADSLTPEEVERLVGAVHQVLTDAVTRSVGQQAARLKAEKRSGMRVHGRTGLPCPVCGDTVREVSFSDSALQYCPTCQTGGKPLADRRLSRLVK
jgi:formamidopyrimidine-DNA glycosylase